MLERQQTRPRAFGIGADAPILLGGAHRSRIRPGGRGHHIEGARRSGSQATWTHAASFQCTGIGASDLFFSARTWVLGRQRL